MKRPARAKRPALERTGPRRNLEGLWGNDPASADSPPPPRGEGGLGNSGLGDVVARSVELGYRVVDTYIRRGREVAGQAPAGGYGPGDAGSDVQGVAGQLVRSASDLAGAWAELLALATRNETAVPGTDVHPPEAGEQVGSPPTAAPIPLRFQLSVTAERPLEVSLDLRSVPARHRLVVHALRGDPPALPRIDDVHVESRSSGHTRIGIRVPAEQPPGRYQGSIVDDVSNISVGELSVIVKAAS